MATRDAPPAERLYEVNQAAADFYAARLRTSRSAAAYLRDHGIASAAVADEPWQLGYAPRQWTTLADHLTAEGFTTAEVTAAGLGFIHRTSGHLLDRFRDRLMFPITDQHHAVVGFTSRDLSGRAQARWINTPETSIYRKRLLLYGLGQQLVHRPNGDSTPLVFLVEGPTDVLAIQHMAAHRPASTSQPMHAVAPCGTNLTREQLDVLRQALPDAHLVLAFDGDPAGRRALDRAYPIAATWPGQVSGLLLPDGQDPADMLARSGPTQALDELLHGVRPLAQIHMTNTIRTLFDSGRITDPVTFAGDRLTAYAAIADLFLDAPHASEQMARAAAEQLGLSPADVAQGIVEAWEARTPDGSGTDPPPDRDPIPDTPSPTAPTRATAPASRSAKRPGRPSIKAAGRSSRGRGDAPTVVSAVACSAGTSTEASSTVASRHDPATGRSVWALADGIGRHREAGRATAMAADIAATVALRSAPAAALHAARAAVNAFYDGVHASQAGDASLIVVAAYPAPERRHHVRFEIAWAGNCRAYTIHAGRLVQLTADHTVARQHRDRGEPVPDGSVTGHLLTSSVRAGDVSVCPCDAGPLLVCNSALHQALPADQLAAELAGISDAQASASRLAAAVRHHDAGHPAVLLIHAASAPPALTTTTAPAPSPGLTVTAPAAALAKTSFATPPETPSAQPHRAAASTGLEGGRLAAARQR